MASSIYVYGREEDYTRYNRNLLNNERFHNKILGIFINLNNKNILFASEYEHEVTSPTVVGYSLMHLLVPKNRSNILEYVRDKLPNFVQFDIKPHLIRWKHTTENNGVIEFRRVEPVKLFGLTLFNIKRTKSTLFTQKVIYSNKLDRGWHKVTDVIYDMSRDRISIILDYTIYGLRT